MAVAAYASLLSLAHVLDNLHYRAPFHLPNMDTKQIETFQQNIHFLVEFVARHSETGRPGIKPLWRKLAMAAFEAEEMIDFYVVKQFDIICGERETTCEGNNVVYGPLNFRSQGGKVHSNLSAFSKEMERVISKVASIKSNLSVSKEEGENKPDAFVPRVGSSSTSSAGKKDPVGIDQHVNSIMDQLTRHEPKLQILPIVGMGGVGKTTLAESIFNNKCIVEHFDIRAWFTISQEYNAEEALRGVVYEWRSNVASESSVELGYDLRKMFFGRRCLVVMDDVWETQGWNDLKKFFPNDGFRSRVVLTTRDSKVATSLGTLDPYKLPFLDEANSWKLFCKTTFEHVERPYASLKQIGKVIVNSCKGLPLEISVIGRMLASNMTRDYWRLVAKNISSFANSESNQHCFEVLSLSYKHLPMHLKPCFLYMRVLREDQWISISDLINSWIAEGFIKPVSDISLEETAHQYAKDLIDRNLLLFRSVKSFRRNSQECCIHDLLRDLCLKESDKESFVRYPKAQRLWRHVRVSGRETSICPFCRETLWGQNFLEHTLIFPSDSTASSRFVCYACRGKYSHITRTKLVRTITGHNIQAGELEENIKVMEVPTTSRYLRIQGLHVLNFRYPSWFHLLWNLQILHLYAQRPVNLPSEIWDMPQLRCVNVPSGAFLCDPAATQVEGEHFIVLKSLHSLSRVSDFACSKQFLVRVPNLKDLHVACYTSYFLCNLKQLQRLEALHIEGASQNLAFPSSLKKLKLAFCLLSWEDMSAIGSLANLEELELYGCNVEGHEWNPNEGGFPRLKQLHIESTDLVYWKADSIHFPVLQELQLGYLNSLEEIPRDIEEISTLHSIKLLYCKESLIKSGVQIWEYQQFVGNETFEFEVDGRPYESGAIEDSDSNS